MKNKITVEICCGSADDIIQAALAGADRVELNSAMLLGGLTATIGSLITAKDSLCQLLDEKKISCLPKIFTMVRPREAGFCYSEPEFKTMLKDTEKLIEHGADGIVFGILHDDGTVDEKRCSEILELVRPLPAVFHRAFDLVADWRISMDSIINLGFKRILTSGQEKSAFLGREKIRQMHEYADGRIEILPGAGIRPDNVIELLEHTACDQIHFSMMKSCIDHSSSANPRISFTGAIPPSEGVYSKSDRGKIAAMLHLLNS